MSLPDKLASPSANGPEVSASERYSGDRVVSGAVFVDPAEPLRSFALLLDDEW